MGILYRGPRELRCCCATAHGVNQHYLDGLTSGDVQKMYYRGLDNFNRVSEYVAL